MNRETPGKFDNLRGYLAEHGPRNQVMLRFDEIEDLVGPLPRGARRARRWWTNDTSRIQARAWRSAGWRVVLVDMDAGQVLLERDVPEVTRPAAASSAEKPSDQKPPSAFRAYLAELHLPLIAFMVLLAIVVGAIGFAFRPGTDQPPIVSTPQITLYVFQKSPSGTYVDPVRVDVDEIVMPENSSTAVLQVDIFAKFRAPGVAQWQLLTSISDSQPYSCPDPYAYLGTTHPDPVTSQNGTTTIAGRSLTPTTIGDFTGNRSANTASNVLGLYGQSPGTVRAGELTPMAEVDLCWRKNSPVAFDGEFASASVPAVVGVPSAATASLPMNLSRSLYFENYMENKQPITAEYNLQAGTLPTTTDPYGWHWSAAQGSNSAQVTATNISASQHEAYLGFISGVLLGVAGGAVVLILQELLEPIRLIRRRSGSASAI